MADAGCIMPTYCGGGDPQWLMRAASCPCVVEEVILSG